MVEIHNALSRRIVELEAKIQAIKLGVPAEEVPDDRDEAEDKEEVSPKKMLKILNRSLKFLKRSNDRLAKDLKVAGKKRPALSEGR